MILQSGNLPVTKEKPGGNVPRQRPPQLKEQAHELLFINQLHDRAKHGPNRRTIGSHVQRHIHRRKRLNSCIRLKANSRDEVRQVKEIEVFRHDSAVSGIVPRYKSDTDSWKLQLRGESRQVRLASYRGLQGFPKEYGKTHNIGTIHSSTQLPRDKHGLRIDPFNSYPIDFRESIPPAIDYCEWTPPHFRLC